MVTEEVFNVFSDLESSKNIFTSHLEIFFLQTMGGGQNILKTLTMVYSI
ncbi:hypothetical protein BH18THE2_BH18THE2_02440 [soil metagenome]